MLNLILATVLAVVPGLLDARAAGRVVHVVDRVEPGYADQYTSLQAAVDALCAAQGGTVRIKRTIPLTFTELNVGCDVEMVAEQGATADVRGNGTDVIAIRATGAFSLRNFKITNSSALSLVTDGNFSLLESSVPALRLEIRKPAVVRMALLQVRDSLHWDSAEDVQLILDRVAVGASASLVTRASLTASFDQVRWGGGIVINGAQARPGLSDLRVSQNAGSLSGGFELTGNESRIFSLSMNKLTLSEGARVHVQPRKRISRESDSSRISIRNMEFTKLGNYLSVQDGAVPVVVEDSKFSVVTSELGFAGLRLLNQGAGVRVLRNEFLVSDTCTQRCAGLKAENVHLLEADGNKFYVYGMYSHAFDAKATHAVLNANEFSGGHYEALIQLTGDPSVPSTLRARRNTISATGMVSVQIGPNVFASMTGNTFSGSGALMDRAGSDIAVAGGLVEDPLPVNTGLHDKNVTTSVDFDGNGCRDIPREANRRDTNGVCPEGKPKPTMPKVELR